MRLFLLIFFFFNALPMGFAQLVQEGTHGEWLDTPEGPDVFEKIVDHQLWIPDPISQRVSGKNIIFMSVKERKEFVSQPVKESLKRRKYSKRKMTSRFSSSSFSKKKQSDQKQLLSFFKNWANACPGDQGKKVLPQNHVELVSFQSLEKLFSQRKADVFIFQYKNSPSHFNSREWKSFLSQVPADKGCLVIAPDPKPHSIARNKAYSLKLEAFFKASNHHCQVIHRVKEQGVQDIIQSVCDRDYRSSMKK